MRISESRPLAILIGITLGLPILAMFAIVGIGGVRPAFLGTFLTGTVVFAFVVGAIFELRRIAGLDEEHSVAVQTADPRDWADHNASHIAAAPPPVQQAEIAPRPVADRAEVVSGNDPTEPPPPVAAAPEVATPEPIIVETKPGLEPITSAVTGSRSTSKKGSEAPAMLDGGIPAVEAAKGKGKSGGRRPVKAS